MLKFHDFSGDVIYGWPLLKHDIALVKVENCKNKTSKKKTIVRFINTKRKKGMINRKGL